VLGETNCNSRGAMMLSSKSIASIQNYFRPTSKVPGITAASFHTTTPKSKSSAALNHHSQNNKPQKQRKFHSLNCDTPYQLCFLRHGQSTWNRDNRFIGWTDTPLTDDGVLEARVAGQMLARSGMKFDEVHTSLLRRCIRTTNLVLMEMKQEYIPVHKHWRLNERHYGNLVGKNKKEVVKLHGQEQVRRWRRSWDDPPPPMKDDHKFHPALDPRYRDVLHKIPKCESLKCTLARSKVYWENKIIPSMEEGKTILIVGHENNLRSLIMNLEGISQNDIINLCLPRAIPLAYRLDKNFKPVDRPDGKLDEATGFLRGQWLGGDDAVKEILERDRKQVYDTSIQENLEIGIEQEKWKRWTELAIGPPQPEMRAKTSMSGDFLERNTGTS
jgi:2,3-bisphosphoglycerate-dependent phosphoglycerate mutase